MANIIAQYDLSNITKTDDFMRFCSQVVGQILSGINGNLDFTNLKTQTVDASFPSIANTAINITHTLNKTGVLFIVVDNRKGGVVYHPNPGNDSSSTIQLSSTVGGGVYKLLLY